MIMLRSFLEVWFIVSSSRWAEECPVVSRRQATGVGGAVQSPPHPRSCVVHLVVELCGRAAVRGGRFPVDGRREAAAAVLVVVGQRQVQQAGAGGQVDVLHVRHLRAAHGTQLQEKGKRSVEKQVWWRAGLRRE